MRTFEYVDLNFDIDIRTTMVGQWSIGFCYEGLMGERELS